MSECGCFSEGGVSPSESMDLLHMYMTKLVLQEEEEKEGDEDAENTETVEAPPQKKAKVTMSVLCVENGVLGGGVRKEAEVRS